MTPDQSAVVLSAGVTGVTALAGAGLLLALSRRRPSIAVFGAPFVIVASLAAGVAVATREMLIDDHTYRTVLGVLLAGAPMALLIGLVMALRVRGVERTVAQQSAEQERARQVEESRRETIRWLSHDLRTPLAGIRALAETIADGATDDPGRAGARIIHEADRLDGMVGDIVELSRLHGKPGREVTPADLDDLVSDAVATVAPLADSVGVQLEAGHLAGARITADAREVTRAVTNIVRNAVQHTPRGGRVTINTATRGDLEYVEVADGCSGIPDEDLARVTEPGWRGDESRHDGGMGLGLTIADEVGRGHGGGVSVANSPESGGCVVTLALGRADA